MAKILVVDDERSIRELAAIVLKKEGHEVELCESGDVACIRLGQDSFDLVLTARPCGNGPQPPEYLAPHPGDWLAVVPASTPA